jgi:hypothetical protein
VSNAAASNAPPLNASAITLVSWGIGHLAGIYGSGLGKLGAIQLQR